MKKNYLFLAAAATMFTACVQSDLVSEMPEAAPQAIGFDAFAEKTTRAEITNVDDLHTVGFQVWGYKAPTATPMSWTNQFTVFDNVTVSGTPFTYTEKKYWDRTSSYKFYAVAPSSDKASYSIAPTTGMITITGAESAKSTVSKDYLIDRNGSDVVNGEYTGTQHDPVYFDFHHIMSKVSFQLKAAVNEEIVVTRLVMQGWNSGNGKFTQTLTATPSSADNKDEWTIPTSGAGLVNLVGTDATQASISLNSDMTTVSKVTDEYIMVPQIIAPDALTFIIDFKIGTEEFIGQVGKLASQQVWGTDAHTTYTISVGPAEINFGVSKVCGWDAGTPGSSLEIE